MVHQVSLLDPEALFRALTGDIEREMAGMLSRIGRAARDKWRQEAQKVLTSTRRDYVMGVQIILETPTEVVIALLPALANLQEQGAPPWDLRETLLKPTTRNVRRSKKGFLYLSVPFRHGSPTSGGIAGSPMPTDIHAAAKKLAPTRSGTDAIAAIARLQPGSREAAMQAYSRSKYGTLYGGRLEEGLAPKKASHHVTDIYAGMVRFQKTYAKASQSSYSTFRTISQDTSSYRDAHGNMVAKDPANWRHPGFPVPLNLVDKVQQYVEDKLIPGEMAATHATA